MDLGYKAGMKESLKEIDMIEHEESRWPFDPHGIRRMIIQALSADEPASPQEAERMIYGRFGPYRPEPGMVQSAVTAYFAGGN